MGNFCKPQDISGATQANQSVVASTENTSRRYFEWFNCGATGKWTNWGASATAGKGSTYWPPNTGYIWQGPDTPTSSFNVFCTAAENYTLKEA